MRRILSFILIMTCLVTSFPAYSKTHESPANQNDEPPSKEVQWKKRSTSAEKWFFSDLPRHIGNDFKETFWNGWHLLAIAGGTGFILAVHQKDPSIQRWFQPNRPLGRTFDKVVNTAANPFVVGGSLITAFTISKLANAPKAALTAGTMFEAWFLTEAMTVGLQQATRRKRPDGSGNDSFPSGHTSGAFALAAVAESFYGPKIGVPAFALASLVGVVRLDSNKHVASDVLAAALLGTLMGLGTAKFHKKEFSNFFLVPSVGDGSAGISLVHDF